MLKGVKKIMEKYHFYDILIYEITSSTSKKDRIEILNNFEKEEDYEVLHLCTFKMPIFYNKISNYITYKWLLLIVTVKKFIRLI